MSRRAAEEARYRSYFYPDSAVLKNKFGIKEQSALDVKEARAVTVAAVTRPKFKDFSLAEFQSVHRHLLGGVYEWAGEVRDYTTGRGAAPFARPEMIQGYFHSEVRKGLQKENYLRGMPPDQFAARSAHYVGEVNAVHPFIDPRPQDNKRTSCRFCTGSLATTTSTLRRTPPIACLSK